MYKKRTQNAWIELAEQNRNRLPVWNLQRSGFCHAFGVPAFVRWMSRAHYYSQTLDRATRTIQKTGTLRASPHRLEGQQIWKSRYRQDAEQKFQQTKTNRMGSNQSACPWERKHFSTLRQVSSIRLRSKMRLIRNASYRQMYPLLGQCYSFFNAGR